MCFTQFEAFTIRVGNCYSINILAFCFGPCLPFILILLSRIEVSNKEYLDFGAVSIFNLRCLHVLWLIFSLKYNITLSVTVHENNITVYEAHFRYLTN